MMESAEARSLIKIARELLVTPDSEPIALALQQYFEGGKAAFVADFFKKIKKVPFNLRTDLAEALSDGQIDSKIWLIEELGKCVPIQDRTIFVLGGWFAILPLLIQWTVGGGVARLRSFDINPVATEWADQLNNWFRINHYSFFAITADMYQLDYHTAEFTVARKPAPIRESPDILINTSCEHLQFFENWYSRIPTGKTLVLQSNDFFDCPGHLNCVESIQDFVQKAPMTKLLFAGEKPLEKYRRFMLIGEK